jgi:two-component system cell cycle response regulator
MADAASNLRKEEEPYMLRFRETKTSQHIPIISNSYAPGPFGLRRPELIMAENQPRGRDKGDTPDGEKRGVTAAVKGRILVIEDDPASMELLAYLLRAFGYAVLSARDGAEGIEMAEHESVDLILCDVILPKADGYEVASYLKKHPALRGIPLVAMTALAAIGHPKRLFSAGFDGYIDKPIAPELFLEQVEAFMQKKN